MAVWMERWGWGGGGGGGAWVNVRCSQPGWSSGTAQGRRAGRIDSQAAGRPPNLITGRNLRQKKSACVDEWLRPSAARLCGAAAESDVNEEEEEEEESEG